MTEAPAPGIFDSLFSPSFQTWVRDFRQQAKEHSTSLTTEGYIRLIIIVGAYCMLRPYLLKLGGRFQAADHDRELLDDDAVGMMSSSPAAVGVSPNMLRGERGRLGGVFEGEGDGGGGGSSDSEEEGGEGEEEEVITTTPRWGRGARRRQRRRKREEEEEEARRALEEEVEARGKKFKVDEGEVDSDREIEEFLRKVVK